jgi:hypothetical protein
VFQAIAYMKQTESKRLSHPQLTSPNSFKTKSESLKKCSSPPPPQFSKTYFTYLGTFPLNTDVRQDGNLSEIMFVSYIYCFSWIYSSRLPTREIPTTNGKQEICFGEVAFTVISLSKFSTLQKPPIISTLNFY